MHHLPVKTACCFAPLRAFAPAEAGEPEIIGADFAQGFAGERPGDELYAAHLTEDRVDGLYGEAIQTLLQLQQTKPAQDLLAQYDAATCGARWSCSCSGLSANCCSTPLNDDEQQLIAQCFSYQSRRWPKQPKVVVHRDFHSRNLIYRQTNRAACCRRV